MKKPQPVKPAQRTGTDRRREMLMHAESCVCNDRQNTYGDAEDNFANIATIANIVLAKKLKVPLDALDVAMFSASIKIARMSTSPRHLDNWTDLIGYGACGGGIVKSETEKSAKAILEALDTVAKRRRVSRKQNRALINSKANEKRTA